MAHPYWRWFCSKLMETLDWVCWMVPRFQKCWMEPIQEPELICWRRAIGGLNKVDAVFLIYTSVIIIQSTLMSSRLKRVVRMTYHLRPDRGSSCAEPRCEQPRATQVQRKCFHLTEHRKVKLLTLMARSAAHKPQYESVALQLISACCGRFCLYRFSLQYVKLIR